MTEIRTDLMRGRAPVGSVAESISLSVGGILMLIPGYVTDGIGILLFIPGLRTIAGVWMLHKLITNNRFKGFIHVGGQGGIDAQRGFQNFDAETFNDADDIIEGDATEHRPPSNRINNTNCKYDHLAAA